MIVALAGRRIDALDAEESRFPLKMKEAVYARIRDFFHKNKVEILVSSAACGADLLAQKAAQELKIQQHIILPFRREKFRRTSVTDRPGDWGNLFDEICTQVDRKGNLIILEDFENNEDLAYSAVTMEFFEYAKRLQSKKEEILGIAVWEKTMNDAENDQTSFFIRQAKIQDIPVIRISTT